MLLLNPDSREKRGGQQMTVICTVALCDHVNGSGRSPAAPVPMICVPIGRTSPWDRE